MLPPPLAPPLPLRRRRLGRSGGDRRRRGRRRRRRRRGRLRRRRHRRLRGRSGRRRRGRPPQVDREPGDRNRSGGTDRQRDPRRRALRARVDRLRDGHECGGERVGHCRRRGEAIGRVARERFRNRRLDRDRNRLARLPHLGRGLGESARDHQLAIGPDERRLADEHLEQDAAERVDVAARVEILEPDRLLGAHVGRRSDRDAARRERLPLLAAGAADRARDPEVGDERVAVRQGGCSPA